MKGRQETLDAGVGWGQQRVEPMHITWRPGSLDCPFGCDQSLPWACRRGWRLRRDRVWPACDVPGGTAAIEAASAPPGSRLGRLQRRSRTSDQADGQRGWQGVLGHIRTCTFRRCAIHFQPVLCWTIWACACFGYS